MARRRPDPLDQLGAGAGAGGGPPPRRARGRGRTAIVVDAGGTSFDVSVVRNGRIPRTRETWLGDRFVGHLTGFPSIDVRTTGSGGGSIAGVDSGGLLTVGPESAGVGARPGCYGRGGTRRP